MRLLNKKDVFIWIGVDNLSDDCKYECLLNQCRDCGHVYQPLSMGLRKILKKIYSSDHAQASTPMGEGNWGMERARAFLGSCNLLIFKSALEIGCANGYILRYLKNKGLKRLVGIEPSLKETQKEDGILFLKDFVHKKLNFAQKFDLIFSAWVFEHLEGINEVLSFCRNNLNDDGRLIFTVPNAEEQLFIGDPGLFMHQHINYFTRESLSFLLSENGFQLFSLASNKGDFAVTAKIAQKNNPVKPKAVAYGYQKKLERSLDKVKKILSRNNLIVHGANQGLSNILSWLGGNFDFTLIDNDYTKQGKVFLNKPIEALTDINVKKYDTVLIIPSAFFDEIKNDYRNRGFRGRIENVFCH